ncbi:glycoside hydrolase, putative [Phytophthora infestans T30-4]|uniref:Glycoside hydrolase, putative n=1 Tax=Phytophthora infestans (strain T30-4) TaxID=403677 RepID=D0P4F1_PHYIT|nr:glycoside hydrolase, putative [Phytophthora infestans T30-4]EEY65305.1 glycoside hydrolase, putative [Phytophthora infestans T30-4]|eukprot:XP_002894826.1 glycoside hydrolase, putative [Phytophthora infestans T30-4]
MRFSISWLRVMHWNSTLQRMQPNRDAVFAGDFLNFTILKDYAELILTEFGQKVKFWSTINEPLSYMYIFYIFAVTDSDEYEAALNLLLAHADMVALFRNLQNQGSCSNRFNLGWFLAPLSTGDYAPMMRESKESYDLIMINHYFSNLITFCDSEHSETSCSSLMKGYFADMGADNTQVHNDSIIGSGSIANPTSCTDHFCFPPSYIKYIRWAHAYDTSTGMLLTENGWCGNETIGNQDQLWYYRTHLEMVHHAIYEEKIPIIGYTAWSFVDNYEWGLYAPRYGLYYVNFPDNIGDKDVYSVPSTYLNRTACTAAKWYANSATTGCFETEPEDKKRLKYL